MTETLSQSGRVGRALVVIAALVGAGIVAAAVSGFVGLAVYAAWADAQSQPHTCECCS